MGDKYWQRQFPADALEVVSCFYAYSNLSIGRPRPLAKICANHYHRLRYFMLDQAERAAIRGRLTHQHRKQMPFGLDAPDALDAKAGSVRPCQYWAGVGCVKCVGLIRHFLSAQM